MDHLIQGLKEYLHTVHAQERKLFESLTKQQNPSVCFITCSDSRVDPNLITQSSPGDIFVLRNAGNIVPPYGAPQGGEAASLEFALVKLEVKDLIVCGHSDCGAMRGLLAGRDVVAKSMPQVAQWLQFADTTKRIMDHHPELEAEAKVRVATKINVLTQLTNLSTHPVVAQRCSAGDLNLHAWYYDIGSGQVLAFDSNECDFLPILDEATPLRSLPRDLHRLITHEHAAHAQAVASL